MTSPSEAERRRVTSRLYRGAEEGRITPEELEGRLLRARHAEVPAELERLVADLPTGPAPVPATQPRSGPPAAPGRHSVVGVFSDAKTVGRWRPRQQNTAVAVFGDAVVDVREAETGEAQLEIQAVSVFGDVTVFVPDGTAVEVAVNGVFGEAKNRVVDGRPPPATPRVRVTGWAVFGDVKVVSTSGTNRARLRDWWQRRRSG